MTTFATHKPDLLSARMTLPSRAPIHPSPRPLHWLPLLYTLAASTAMPRSEWNVREFGARGDGQTPDTAAIQKALDSAAAAGGGVVRIPPGRYLTGTLQLRSHITLVLEPGARLVGTTNLDAYLHPAPPPDSPEARWGRWHRGLLIGENIENVTIRGPGVIDGNRVSDPEGEEHMRGPHALVFMHVRGLTLEDLTITDAGNYGLFFMASDDVTLRRVRFVGGWDGVHWRGTPGSPCRRVEIRDCEFETGDDAIAGRYWEQTLITGCSINSSCNGIRLIGPARDLTIRNCHFFGPGRRPHLTSRERRRNNMLAGILLQPGAWDPTEGILDQVWIVQNTMRNVAAPVALWTRPGNRAGRIVIQSLDASGIYRAPLSLESWAPDPLDTVVLRNVRLEFTGKDPNSPTPETVSQPGVDVRPLPAWGLYARRIRQLSVEGLHLRTQEPDPRPAATIESVAHVALDELDLPGPSARTEALVLRDCARVSGRDTPATVPAH
ncbi:glycoside hydrolase family 28 protein [Limisphaera sp. 4302-co]|uniref:glycoside hydrolase family 28 protein n=1 Tax=Limisphaera sp. 4302-co TaxID=3400417 RepID=UPI003C1796E4